MKRSLLGLIALLALACASLVLTQPSPTAASRGNVASGSGSGHFKDISLSFGAADHGEFNYTGQATFIYETARQKVTIDVECVSVAGNTASIAGTVTKSTNPDFPAGEQPYPVVFNVVDNGEGAAAPPDLLTPPRYGKCGDFPMAYTDSDRGNIQVRFVAPD